MHSISLYIVETEEVLNFPHVISNGLALIPITEKLIKIVSNDQQDSRHEFKYDDDFRASIETYLLGISSLEDIAFVETDYFGGSGDQSARLINDHITQYDSINTALAQMGIVRSDDVDEFDTVGLGKYRTNEEIITEWENKVGGRTVASTYTTYLLRDVPAEIELNISEERSYIAQNQYISQIGPAKRLVREVLNKSTSANEYGPIKIINSVAEYGPESSDLVVDSPYSALSIQYAVDGGGYTFMKITPKNSRNGIALILVQVECDEIGNHVLHKQVEEQIIAPFHVDINLIGITGAPIARPKPVKRVVYQCACGKDMKLENTMLVCECGQKYEHEND
jgi:hypothetical protein